MLRTIKLSAIIVCALLFSAIYFLDEVQGLVRPSQESGLLAPGPLGPRSAAAPPMPTLAATASQEESVSLLPTVTPTPRAGSVWTRLFTLATATPSPVRQFGVVNTELLNVRSGPSTDSEVVGMIGANVCLPILAIEDNWVQVSLRGGQLAWSLGDYLDIHDICPAGIAVPFATQTTSHTRAGAQFKADLLPTATATVAATVPVYVGQPPVPNASTVVDVPIYECFGQGNDGLRRVPAGTPVQILGRGAFVPSDEVVERLGDGPFLKVKLWDGQVAWMPVRAINFDASAYPLVGGSCEDYDRMDWANVVRSAVLPSP